MGLNVNGLDNIYILTIFYFILALFLIVAILTAIGFIRMNRTTYSKCPSCSEPIASGAIICKSCGVNINSISGASDQPQSKMRKFVDYLENLHPYQIRNYISLTFFAFLLFCIIFVFVKI
ncbi:zinc ribbon domain-containing protein [Pseudoneobacillus sp. C159]